MPYACLRSVASADGLLATAVWWSDSTGEIAHYRGVSVHEYFPDGSICTDTLVSLAKGGLPLILPMSLRMLLWARLLVYPRQSDTVEEPYCWCGAESTSLPE